MALSSLKKLVTESMAIDLGSANTIIAVKGRDVVLDQPSLVAVNELTEEIVAYGDEAFEMQGREGRDIVVKYPLSGGVVADFELTKSMLSHFVQRSKSGGSQVSRQAVVSMLSDVTHVEQRALLNAAEDAHIGKVYMMEEGLAAAFGADVQPGDKRASAVVDVGAGSTNVAVITKGSIAHSRAERIGSHDINEALTVYLRRSKGIHIGAETAETIKRKFITATPPENPDAEYLARGRDVQSGSPHAVPITAAEIYPITEGIVKRIAQAVNDTLTELRPEIAADIYDRGILFTGGGALLEGFDQYLRNFVNLSVIIPDEPNYATVRGLIKMFDEPELLERVSRTELSILQNAEVSFES